MTPASAKAKGRRASAEMKELLLKNFPALEEGDIEVVPAGVNGPDLWLSPKAKQLLPFAIEVKNQEKLNVWEALKQAKSHAKAGEMPLLVFRRNKEQLHVCLSAEHFFQLLTLRITGN
jgi:hypothetical protein